MAFASMLGNILAPLISSKSMELYSPWLPLLLAFALIPIGTSPILFITETLHFKKVPDPDAAPQEGQHGIANLKSHMRQTFIQLKESILMLKNPSVAIVLAIFLIQMPLYLGITQFFLQYFSKRFEWSL